MIFQDKDFREEQQKVQEILKEQAAKRMELMHKARRNKVKTMSRYEGLLPADGRKQSKSEYSEDFDEEEGCRHTF